MFNEIGRVGVVSHLLSSLKENYELTPREFMDDQVELYGINLSDLKFAYGNEHLVIVQDETVIAIDISGQSRSEKYMRTQTLKHQILHLLFPDNFPDFYEYVSEEDSPTGFAYTIRERIQESHRTNDEVNESVGEIFESISTYLGQIGCPVCLDKCSSRNFYQSYNSEGKETFYYMDVVSDVMKEWNLDLLREHLFLSGQSSDEMLNLIEELQQILVQNEYILAWE